MGTSFEGCGAVWRPAGLAAEQCPSDTAEHAHHKWKMHRVASTRYALIRIAVRIYIMEPLVGDMQDTCRNINKTDVLAQAGMVH